VLGALALDEYEKMADRWRIVYFLLPLLIVIGVYLNYQHNYVVLTDEPDKKPLVGAMLIAVALLIPVSAYLQTLIFGIVLVFNMSINISAIKLADEDKTCKEAAQWYLKNESQYKGKQMYANHVMLFYFMERTRGDFSPEPKYVTTEADMEKMPSGSIILWDSHYAYRPSRNSGVNIDYFAKQPDKYALLQQFVTPQQNFGVIVLQKK
jgi:hypothetical protein